MRVRNLYTTFLSIAAAVGSSVSSMGQQETPYSLTVTFIGWTNSTGAGADIQAKFTKVNGPRIISPTGDWAMLAITNHDTEFLRFDSISAEYQLSHVPGLQSHRNSGPGFMETLGCQVGGP